MWKNVVRNSLVAYVLAMSFACTPLVLPVAGGFIQNAVGGVAFVFVLVALAGWLLTGLMAFEHREGAWLAFASAVIAVVLVVYVGVPQFLFLVTVVGTVAWVSWMRSTREERAVKRAERERAFEAEEQAQARLNRVDAALADVSDAWLIDALGTPENTDGDTLIRMVADLPDGTEYALARAHRKGVKAEGVTVRIAAGSFTEADADRLAREVA